MTSPKVLLLGGNGQIARLMTPLMLAESWNITSVIRNARQKEDILKLGRNGKGALDVLVSDLEKIKTDEDAKTLLEETKPNYVVWMAGAGGASSLYAVDQEAAKRMINASTATPSITKFLMISFPGSRRNRAPWWNDSDWKQIQGEQSMFPHNSNSKIAADEHLVAMAKANRGTDFQAISLRPTWLSNGRATGKVALGKVTVVGQVTRADVAAVGVELLKRGDTTGWYDLVQGKDSIPDAVSRVVQGDINCIEGEDLNRIYNTISGS